MNNNLKNISRFMSLVLRHKPEEIGIRLDEQGWVPLDELMEGLRRKGMTVDKALILQIVATNDKQRFALSEDQTRIRASQGHSLEVDLGLEPVAPPEILYHGTTSRFLENILQTGLKKQNRQYVHLSIHTDTAQAVGSRHGKPVILAIDAGSMHRDGFSFYLSENKVWLTLHVPPQYIRV